MTADLSKGTTRMKLKRILAAAAAALSLGTSACATVETPPAGAVPGPALWQVVDKDTTIYLFGTVHALPASTTWFDGRIERAFNAADEMVTEIDVSNASASTASLQAASALPQGETLRAMMTTENKRQFEEALVGLGLPVDSLDRYEPWFAAMTLSLLPLVRQGYDTQSGVELSLNGRAGEAKKRGALETIDQQVALFDTLPQDAQLAFLDETVEKLDEAKPNLDAMVAEWLKGDAAMLAELMNQELTDPILRDRLLTERNRNWAGWIESRLDQPGTVFIAVGAGHLAGVGSVQDQLRQRGIRVKRIWQ